MSCPSHKLSLVSAELRLSWGFDSYLSVLQANFVSMRKLGLLVLGPVEQVIEGPTARIRKVKRTGRSDAARMILLQLDLTQDRRRKSTHLYI